LFEFLNIEMKIYVIKILQFHNTNCNSDASVGLY